MYARATPQIHLMPSIQAPPLGRLMANVPTMKNGTPRPRANIVIAPVPRAMFFVVAIQIARPVSPGPVQGAARSAHTRPRPNAPFAPTPPTPDSLLVRLDGSASSNAPNIDDASARNTSAM